MKDIMRPIFVVCLVLFTTCKKKETPGTVLITVKHLQALVPDATISMKTGTREMPPSGSGWNKQQTTNANGQCYFTELADGDYYFFAQKIDGTDTMVAGRPVTVSEGAGVRRWEILLDIN